MSDIESDLSDDDVFEDAVDYMDSDAEKETESLSVDDLAIEYDHNEEDFDPEMILRVKDLDTGMEYKLEKVYKIKDLDSGKVCYCWCFSFGRLMIHETYWVYVDLFGFASTG